jgi:hypothetical protein
MNLNHDLKCGNSQRHQLILKGYRIDHQRIDQVQKKSLSPEEGGEA